MFIASSFIIALSVPLIKILTTKDFYSAWEYVPTLALAMVFSAFANFMGSVYVVEKRSKNSFLTTMVGAALNIALNLALIPKIGTQGAAVATVVSYFAVFIIRTLDAKKYIPFKAQGLTVTVNTIVVSLQCLFMIFSLPFCYIVQAISIIILLIVNFRFIWIFAEKILKFLKLKK